jgi:lipopolysaccharide export system ATP-binding protein
MKPSHLLLVGACALLLSGAPALAEKADKNKPMNVEADALKYDDLRQTSVFTGRVVVTKGTILIRGAKVEVKQDPEGYQFGVVTAEPGKQAYYKQKRDGLDEYIEGEAQTIEYDGKSDKVKFIGRAEMRRFRGSQVNDEVSGSLITYDNSTDVFTVDGVDLSVPEGAIYGILGPNGAGKTTSFYMIVGLVRADDGEITIDGQSVEHMPIHRRSRLGLSYLPQEASIFRKLNVQDNVRAVLELQRGPDGRPLKRDEIEARLDSLLQDLRVDHLRDSPAVALSGGERRRVEIARALATQPRFILLDEPFAGIDPIAVIEIQRIISFLKSRGIGVLITDHNVRETLGICDHAYIISEGRVLAQGTPSEIVNNADVRRVYLGEHFRM